VVISTFPFIYNFFEEVKEHKKFFDGDSQDEEDNEEDKTGKQA